ncbi:MAG: hypothetical protein B6I38_02405, partial [Anaerolineaceae bacterium 4572_5.1]
MIAKFPKKFRSFLTDNGTYTMMLAPLLLFVIIIAIYPIFFSFKISFFDYRLTDPNQSQTFIGFNNYIQAYNDPLVRKSIWSTLVFVFGTVSLEIAAGLGLALLMNAETRISNVMRSFLMLPMALPSLVVGLVWRALYNVDFGVLPYYLKLLGVDLGAGPLTEISMAMPAVILVDIWQWSPLLMFIFLAGMKSLPIEPYEAAHVDGASRWQRFIYITLPLLKPTFLIAILLRTMQSFKVFDIIFT